MKKFYLLTKTLLVAALLMIGANAWAQTTWTFVKNVAVWGGESVTLKGGNQYDENASAVLSGGVTFTGTSGFVSTAKGIGFYAVGSTSDENISIVVPAGYKATVSVYTSGNRTVVGSFNGETQTFNAAWASSTKEFNNAGGSEDVTLYLYCNQNPGGEAQNRAPFLESIVLTDMSAVKSYPWTANAVATISGVKTTIKTYNSTADVDEGSEYTVVVDKVIKYEDEYYELTDAAFAPDVFCKTYTMGSAAANHEYTYSKVENVAFYGEVEAIYSSGVRPNKADGVNVLSNASGYSVMGADGYIILDFNVPANGLYDVIVGMNNTNDKDRGFNYSIDGAAVSETINVKAGNAYVQNISNQVLALGDHTIQLNLTYSLTPIFDYVLVIKKGDLPASVSATITAAGWATFSSEYAVSIPDGVEAYAAKLEGDKVTLTQVDAVPANTGVILKAAEGVYNLPVVASADPIDTDLNISDGSVTGDESTIYVLGDGKNGVGFYWLKSGNTLEAGKAYLEIIAESPARGFIGFEGATGINEVNVNKAAVKTGKIYNLNGQIVNKPSKGLFIVDGKVVSF